MPANVETVDADDSIACLIEDEEDNVPTDVSDSPTDEEEEDVFCPGDIIWAKHGRIWYPAKIVRVQDLSDHLQSHFRSTNNTVQ